ncbi:ornithine carbamoyltransferase [Natronorubrum sp. FCH18a]|uniref:ornithine carbamoyltransferase n=1 Tax=Natronorubrum sp. FCH18a TaxID=3447018 RepID=UPI003F519FCF
MNQPRHLLTIADLDLETVASLCATAKLLDQDRTGRAANANLSQRVVALLFERPSTRTRLGFESGMAYLGGHAVSMSAGEFQFGHGTEDVTDAARAASQFVDGVLVRTGDHETLEQFTSAAEIPVVNALSDRAHPCEALADLYFLQSRFETIEGLPVTWVGDCTNVARSFASVCVLAGIDVRIACPPTYRFDDETIALIRSLGPGSLRFFDDPVSAVEGSAVVYTDVWTSMGQEDEREERLAAFSAYQVNSDLLSSAPDAIVMHCLPANRGKEITTSVLDGDRSVVWQQAKTRLPMQQAILEYVCT